MTVDTLATHGDYGSMITTLKIWNVWGGVDRRHRWGTHFSFPPSLEFRAQFTNALNQEVTTRTMKVRRILEIGNLIEYDCDGDSINLKIDNPLSVDTMTMTFIRPEGFNTPTSWTEQGVVYTQVFFDSILISPYNISLVAADVYDHLSGSYTFYKYETDSILRITGYLDGQKTVWSLNPALDSICTPYVTITSNANGCFECDSLAIGDYFLAGSDTMLVVDRAMLDSMITGGFDVTKVCVSHITDMQNLLAGESNFNQDIRSWDVSNVTNMNRMFKKASSFNQAIGNWDVGNVNRMTAMFASATVFNQDLSNWCVRSFLYFTPANFAVSSALVPQHYPKWGNCPQDFNGIASLATGAFLDSNGCLNCLALNVGDYFEWNGDTMLVVDRSMLDSLVLLHDDLSKVCVSHITDMKDALRGLFWFNTAIGNWDVSNVTDMTNMFWGARKFNQDIGNWNVGNVTRMSRMFKSASAFNSAIGNWEVSKVERFREMFRNADAFNQAIGAWDVSNVLNAAQMQSMFRSADQFSQNLSNWCVTNVSSKPVGFDANSPLLSSQLPLWGTCGSPQQPFITHPEDVYVDLSQTDSALFVVNCLDTTATYQWQINSALGWISLASNSTHYAGGQQKELSIWEVTSNYDGLELRCFISYGDNLDTTSAAVLNVIGISAQMGAPISFEEAIIEFIGESHYQPLDIEMRVLPNPTTGVFKLSPALSGYYRLFNSKGEALEHGPTKAAYDLSNYPSGVYVLRIFTETTTHQVRVNKH